MMKYLKSWLNTGTFGPEAKYQFFSYDESLTIHRRVWLLKASLKFKTDQADGKSLKQLLEEFGTFFRADFHGKTKFWDNRFQKHKRLLAFVDQKVMHVTIKIKHFVAVSISCNEWKIIRL